MAARAGLAERRHAVGLDLGFGLAVVVGLWMTTVPSDGNARWVQLTLASVAIAGVLVRRRWPGPALMVTVAVTGIAGMLALTFDPFLLTSLVLFSVAQRRGSRLFPWWMGVGALVVAVYVLCVSSEGVEERFRWMVLSALVIAVAWILGVRTRQVQHESTAGTRAEERELMGTAGDSVSDSAGDSAVSARLRGTSRCAAGEVGLDRLTTRERETLVLIGRGLSNTEIAAAMFVTPTTVRTYVSRILSKVDARDRAGLVVLAYESGLVGADIH